MISMARKETPAPGTHGWLPAPPIWKLASILKSSIWEASRRCISTISTTFENDKYSETNSPINPDGCQTVWANVICIIGPYIFGGCEVWFGISTWSYSVKNNTCAELFGLVLPRRTYLLNDLICKDDMVELQRLHSNLNLWKCKQQFVICAILSLVWLW